VDFQADAADAVPPVVSPPVEPIPGLAGMLGDEEGDPGLVMPPGHVFACPRTWYAEADFVYLNRQSDEITLFGDNSKGMDRLGFELGGRLTVGRLRDCTEGFEFVYIGPHEWVQSETRVGALDSLNSRFVGAGGVNVSSFKFAERQWQRYESKLHSFELSRKWWGWDVISTSFGLRYMYIGEEIRHVSVDDTDGTGRFLIGTENNLVGPQLGFELFKPCGRFRSSFRGKACINANFRHGQIALTNGVGGQQFDNSDDEIRIGLLGELGYFVDYQILRNVTIRAGFEMLYLTGIAAAAAQPVGILTPTTGNSITGEEVFYYGVTGGVETTW